MVQEQIDMYATYHNDFPPASTRPRGTLYIVDRAMDLIAPLVHEFTYQAMVHDLLPIKEGEKITYKVTTNEDAAAQETKELAITEKDKLWLANRHQHMKDTIEKLMGEFQKFLDANPHFASQNASNATNLSAIKDMMAGLPQFQEMKEIYSLHLTMSQDAMNVFQKRKLPDLASIEQVRSGISKLGLRLTFIDTGYWTRRRIQETKKHDRSACTNP
jgi:syntaxin-binding protein 1